MATEKEALTVPFSLRHRALVASKLRSTASRLGPNMDACEFASYVADILDPSSLMRWDKMMMHLADLVDPGGRTAEMVAYELRRASNTIDWYLGDSAKARDLRRMASELEGAGAEPEGGAARVEGESRRG